MSPKLAAALFFAFTALAPAAGFRAATFNIGAHFTTSSGGVYYPDYSLGAPGTPDHDTVRDILGRIDADVVALQEIHSADISAGDVGALAASLGYPYIYIAPSTNVFDTSLHVIFLSRFPFLTQTSAGSPAGSKELTRLFPAVKVDVPGTTRDPVLISAHLKSGTTQADRFRRAVELRRLAGYLGAQGLTQNDNFVVMGDFNLSSVNTTFAALPADLPASYDLGADITLPISYSTDPPGYFSGPGVTRLDPRQLDNSKATFPSSGSAIDLFLVSPAIAGRPLRTEIYNSTLDASNTPGLRKAGPPLAAGTSAAASDHYALFADLELDAAVPYAFAAPGETVTEAFTGFPGTYDPSPWVITGGVWKGVDAGASAAAGFRAYGSAGDPALGFLPAAAGGSATATFVNQSAEILTALRISFTAEQWRSAPGGTADTLGAELIVGGVARPLPGLTFHAATDLPAGAIAGGVSAPRNMTVSGLGVAPGASFGLRFTFTPGAGAGILPADVFVNEFHYDNTGTDTGEFIEVVAGPGFTGGLSDIDVLLYNGGNGTVYDTLGLGTRFTLANTTNGFRVFVADLPSNGIQNGPDGIAVVNKTTGQVLHFLSYGGTFTATAGLATGVASTNTGVSQNGEPISQSALGLVGSGGTRGDFTWSKIAGPYSKGQPNAGQLFAVPTLPPQGIAIDDLAVTFLPDNDGDGLPDADDPDDDNDGFTDSDELVFGTNPLDAGSRFAMAFTYPAPGRLRLSFPTATGRAYTVESSADLSQWSDVAVYPGTGVRENADLAVEPLEMARFYRIRVTLP